MKYINVRFGFGGQTYTYKAEDPNVMVDDMVVVHNQVSNKTSVVKVVKVHEHFSEDPSIRYTWIVQRVDFTLYQHRCNEDAQELDESRELKERL